MGSIFYGQKYPHLARKILQNRSKTLQNLAFFTFPNIAKSVTKASQFTVLQRFSSDRFKRNFRLRRKLLPKREEHPLRNEKEFYGVKNFLFPPKMRTHFCLKNKKVSGKEKTTFQPKKRVNIGKHFLDSPFQRKECGLRAYGGWHPLLSRGRKGGDPIKRQWKKKSGPQVNPQPRLFRGGKRGNTSPPPPFK